MDFNFLAEKGILEQEDLDRIEKEQELTDKLIGLGVYPDQLAMQAAMLSLDNDISLADALKDIKISINNSLDEALKILENEK